MPLEAQESGEALSSGAAALNSGKYDSAVKQLSSAINSDKISPAEAAKALYLRGIAYRKLNQHSRSIADLGAAIWLGLPPTDRLKAQVNRGLAYRAAGLSTQGDAEIALARKSDQGGDVDRLIAENGGAGGDTTAIAAFSTEVHTGDQGSGIAPTKPEPTPGFNTTVTGGDKPQAPPAQTADASSRSSTSVGIGDQPQPPARQGPTPAPGSWSTSTSDAASEAPSSGGNRVSRWFNSLTTSSGDQAPPPPASSGAPASAPAPASPAPRAPSAPSAGWDASTQIVTADARPASGADSGSYRLQLTSSRSEAEAKELWQKVVSQNPGLAGREPDIQKTDIGGLGTFYRLQIGPFPDKAESLKLCNALKRSGVDCFLVTG
jgi:SPOR domain